MNVLLIIGLVLFALCVVWIYVLFMTNTMSGSKKPKEEVEVVYDDVIGHCTKLFEQGMHAELQRYAQRRLASDFSNAELRKILAKSLMESGNEQMAIMHFEAIASITPKDIETQEILARYYSENNFKSRAIEAYEKIYSNDPGNVEAVESLAKLYEETGKYEKAIEMYKLILDAEVDENRITELKYILAELYNHTGDGAKAFIEYERIYKNDPDNLEILMLLADLAYKNKYWQDCLKYYKKIISIVGDDFEMLEKIAQIQVILENWAEAILTYQKLVSLETPESANYLYHQNELCNALLKNRQIEEAINILQVLITQYPQETSFLFTLAQAYAMQGEFQVGINLYNRLLDELPPEQGELIVKYISNVICLWAQDLFAKGEYNLAFDKFFEALKYNEENDEIYYQLGKCNYYIKSIQDAISHFKRAISIKPQDSRYYFALGCAYDEIGSIKSAKTAFQDAVNIDPMNIKARIAYAIALTKELEYAQSIEQFLEVLKYVPTNADTLYNVALAYELTGDIERAIKYYKQAIDAEPKHKEARHNIELLLGEPYNPPISQEKKTEILENNYSEQIEQLVQPEQDLEQDTAEIQDIQEPQAQENIQDEQEESAQEAFVQDVLSDSMFSDETADENDTLDDFDFDINTENNPSNDGGSMFS